MVRTASLQRRCSAPKSRCQSAARSHGERSRSERSSRCPSCLTIAVFYGQEDSGIAAAGSEYFHHGASLDGDVQENAWFGASHFNRDDRDDLAVGMPRHSKDSSNFNSGAIYMLYSTLGGLTTSGHQFFSQQHSDVHDVSEGGDRFGGVLTIGDLDDDLTTDLVVGVPYEDFDSTRNDSGIVQLFFGKAGSRLEYTRDDLFRQ